MLLPRWIMSVAVAVLLANASPLHAQQGGGGQKAKSQSVQGTVLSIGSDGSVTISDKNGAPFTLYIDDATTFQFDKNPATFSQTVGIGVSIKADVLADGTAVQVTSKTAKNSNSTSNTPNNSNSNAPKVSSIDQLQLILDASDEEWSILRPLIVDIQSLQSQISAAIVSLKSVQPPTLSLEETVAKLTALRDAHLKLTEQLAKDRAELTNVVTLRQELILVQLGIVE